MTRAPLMARIGPKRRRLDTAAAPTAAPAGRVPRVARLLALAHKLDDLLRQGTVVHEAALARLGHVSRARITQIMNLLYLAPDIQEQILFWPATERGRDLLHLGHLQALTRILDWQSQRAWWRAVNDRLAAGSPVGRRVSSPKRSENLP
jgi:hypothetical protein